MAVYYGMAIFVNMILTQFLGMLTEVRWQEYAFYCLFNHIIFPMQMQKRRKKKNPISNFLIGKLCLQSLLMFHT